MQNGAFSNLIGMPSDDVRVADGIGERQSSTNGQCPHQIDRKTTYGNSFIKHSIMSPGSSDDDIAINTIPP